MDDNTIIITKDQLRQIARYEITFKEIFNGAYFDEVKIFCRDVYPISLDDLYQALQAIKAADPTIHDFGEYWVYPISQLPDEFDLYKACGDIDGTLPKDDEYPGLKTTDEEYFQNLWWDLEDIWEDFDDYSHISEIKYFDKLISDFSRFLKDRNLMITERQFSDADMQSYIKKFIDPDYLNKATNNQVILANEFINRLCSKNNEIALRLKGFACYGGNRLFPCNWEASRDCFIRLFDIQDDPEIAERIANIYYEGLCNRGIPEYDVAFSYYSIAAANGLYESMCKQADMYYKGLGCKKSPHTARTLYQKIYNECGTYLQEGKSGKFTDAALMMGNVFENGIGGDVNLPFAYFCYLQAEYGTKMQASDRENSVDSATVATIQKRIKKIRDKLPKDFFQEFADFYLPYVFEDFCKYNGRCKLSKSGNETTSLKLTSEFVLSRTNPDQDPLLVIIPEISFCERIQKATYILGQGAEIWFTDNSDSIFYTFCIFNNEESRYEFWYDDELAAWVKSDYYRFFDNRGLNIYRLVTVRFSASGRTYDYICEDTSVGKGDKVIVNGYYGETEVTVIEVITRRKSELALPVERYKKILRKA